MEVCSTAPAKIGKLEFTILLNHRSNSSNMLLPSKDSGHSPMQLSAETTDFSSIPALLHMSIYGNWISIPPTSRPNADRYFQLFPFCFWRLMNVQELLDFAKATEGFAIWSIKFSGDNREIIAGGSDNSWY